MRRLILSILAGFAVFLAAIILGIYLMVAAGAHWGTKQCGDITFYSIALGVFFGYFAALATWGSLKK